MFKSYDTSKFLEAALSKVLELHSKKAAAEVFHRTALKAKGVVIRNSRNRAKAVPNNTR